MASLMASVNGSSSPAKGDQTNSLIQWLEENGAIIHKLFPNTVPGKRGSPFLELTRRGRERAVCNVADRGRRSINSYSRPLFAEHGYPRSPTSPVSAVLSIPSSSADR